MQKEMRGSSHGFGLRAVAVFEGVKGLLFLGLSFGVLALRHTNVHAAIDTFISRFGINPEAHYPRMFAERMGSMTDKGLWCFAILFFVISLLRFSECYGLWFEKAWGEWLTLISAGVYLPLEVHHVFAHPNWVWILILAANTTIVIYLARVLASQKRETARQPAASPALVQRLEQRKTTS